MNVAALLPASAVAPLADASRSGATAAVASSRLARRQGRHCLAVGAGVCKQGGPHWHSCSLAALPSRASTPGMDTMGGALAKCLQRSRRAACPVLEGSCSYFGCMALQ